MPFKVSKKFAQKHKKKANPKNMKKTTQKGAYKPQQKKQISIRRAPVVECKKDERYDWNGLTFHDTTGGSVTQWGDRLAFRDLEVGDAVPITNNNANQVIVHAPETFIYRSQGVKHNEMMGDSVFIKYLKAKIELKLPENDGLIHFPQCQMYLVHGFVDKSVDANEHTTPTLANFTRSDYRQFITDQVDKYFTTPNEPMRFQPKGRINSAIKILGKKEIVWSKNKSILPDPVRESATQAWGSLPTKIVDCEWPMMRKVKYEVLPDATLDPANQTLTKPANYFVNNNNGGFPFWAIYVPGAENLVYSEAVNRIQIRDNDVCYYTDS